MEAATVPETPAPTPAAPEPEPVPTDRPAENVIAEARSKQRKAESEAADLRKRLEALEDKDRTESERATKRAETAEAEAAELRSQTQRLERGGWLRSAATEAGFLDPDDAVAFTDVAEVEDAREAKAHVKKLAERKPHLLKPKDEGPPKPGLVIKAGETQTPAKPTGIDTTAEASMLATELAKFRNNWHSTTGE
jgi:hypothetical protein